MTVFARTAFVKHAHSRSRRNKAPNTHEKLYCTA